MSRPVGAAALFVAAILSPTEAQACSAASGNTALIHNALPADLDDRLIVARVDVEWADTEALHRDGVTARVHRIIQGDYDGELMILWSADTSCSRSFENGRSGLIAGIPLRMEGSILVVEAFEVSRASGYRLPDGYTVPESYLEIVREREAAHASKR
ncbi:MAG TPA: hypothetical protein VF603_13075 [Allosphingosinicella sp.]|jgi:hypothetical protein